MGERQELKELEDLTYIRHLFSVVVKVVVGHDFDVRTFGVHHAFVSHAFAAIEAGLARIFNNDLECNGTVARVRLFFLLPTLPREIVPPSDPLKLSPLGEKVRGGQYHVRQKGGTISRTVGGGRFGVKKGEQRLSPRLP